MLRLHFVVSFSLIVWILFAAAKPYHKKSVISLPWKKQKSKSKSKSRVFGAPLSDLIVNSELPELLQVRFQVCGVLTVHLS